ncbi:DMT family transporter [Dorea sp. D27]|uniref:DMT family transporter n=1 Tax=Dorea sp. D27 TaxID=658665 RepID=UPI0006736843|nr:DMT family transporter [Dorea sp. D27]KMZ53419.1 putative membrane protein [Dorea sp. D27]
MIGFFIALLSGALMSVQGVFNTQVTKTTGMWVSNGWVQLSAFALCLVAWLIAGRDSVMTLAKVEPKYVLLGGVIGAGITWTVIKSMEQLGPAKAALLIVISQLIIAYVIELFGLFGVDKQPLEWRRVIGMAIALIGVAIFQWK